jgi:hypothetical protein
LIRANGGNRTARRRLEIFSAPRSEFTKDGQANGPVLAQKKGRAAIATRPFFDRNG